MSDEHLFGASLIKSLINEVPLLPGVYQMFNDSKQIIYIGKAKNLKNRLSQYIKVDSFTKTHLMLENLSSLKYIITNTEVDALILEAQLIKKHKPKFNILLKDDKSFPFIKLRLDHDYPQLIKYRGKDLSGGHFFGPFTSNEQVNITLNELQKIFKLRSCSDSYFAGRTRPCLQYQIKRCVAPCVNKVLKEEYIEIVKQTKIFLSGKSDKLQKELSITMEKYSENMEFEKAAGVRDKIKALSYIQMKSGIIQHGIIDVDVIAIVHMQYSYCIQVAIYRNAQACGSMSYFPENTMYSDIEEVLTAFLLQFYYQHKPPNEIILNHKISNFTDLEKYIIEMHQMHNKFSINFNVPSTDEKYNLLQNAVYNAENALTQHNKDNLKHHNMMYKIQDLFSINNIPKRIEIYDNSHIMGSDAVGVMVVAGVNGFEKNEYRIFNIKHVKEGDDYAMLEEVLYRRLDRLKKESGKKPDLIIVDGGKGHLRIVDKVMKHFKFDINFVCMSKGPMRRAGLEEFHLVDKPSFTLDKNTDIMKYLQILRDEAHNFAIKSHRSRRSKKISVSQIDSIPNIGNIRKKALLNHFGSYKEISQANVKQLMLVNGISKKIAENIFKYFNGS